jgi:hypothetical protein
MAYIGNTPADKYQTLQKQSFTTSATDTYTLSYAVTNPQDLALFINNVRQNPNDAYTVSNTTLTLSSSITSSDTMYAVFLGRAVETVAPALSSVTNDMLAGSINENKLLGSIPNAKLANSSITLNGSAVSLGGSATVGGTNTPSFHVYASSSQAIGDNTQTKVTFNTEVFDTDNGFASNTYTIPSGKGGKYLMYASIHMSNAAPQRYHVQIRQNNSEKLTSERGMGSPYGGSEVTGLINASEGDTIDVYVYHNGINTSIDGGISKIFFGGFKLI